MAGGAFKAGSVYVDVLPRIDDGALRRNLKASADRAGKAAPLKPAVEIDPRQVTRDTQRATEQASRGAKVKAAFEVDQDTLRRQITATENKLKSLRVDAAVAPEVDRAKLNKAAGVAEERLSRLKARVNVDQRQVGREADKAGGAFSSAFKRGVGAAAGFFAVDRIMEFGRQVIAAGSDAQQGIGAVESVFQQNTATVERWASQSSTAVGLSANEYRNLATVLGAALGNMGVATDQVAAQTNNLIKLGADLAATYGGTTADAVDALSAALRGETDPIERYGISVNATAVSAELAAKGLDKLGGAAGRTAKTQTLLEIITRQSAAAQGSFARESDTLAGQQQRLQARFEDLQTSLSGALVPALTASLTVVSGMADAFGGLPGPVQAGVVVVGALGTAAFIAVPKVLAFKAALDAAAASGTGGGAIGRMRTGLGATAGFLMGPWGVALAAGVAVVGVFAARHQQAKQRVEELTAAIKADGGAIADNTREQITNTLAQNGALEAARNLGLNLGDVASAAAGNQDALARVNTALGEMARVGPDAAKGGNPFTGQARTSADADVVRQAITGVRSETDKAKAANDRLGEASTGMAAAQRQAAEAQARTKAAVGDATAAIAKQRTAMQQLIDKFTILREGGLSVARAQDALAEAFDTATQSARSTRNSFDSNTKAGRTNRAAIADLASAINDKVTADFRAKASTGDVEGATQDATAATRRYRGQLIEQATAAFGSRKAAKAYVDQLLLTPKQVSTNLRTTGDAARKIHDLQDQIKELQGKTVTVSVRGTTRITTGPFAGKELPTNGDGPGIEGTKLQARAIGGPIHGPGTGTSDSILGVDRYTRLPTALVSNGEYVINRESTSKYRPLLELINAGQLKLGGMVNALAKRAAGGPVVRINTATRGINGIVPDLEDLIGDTARSVASKVKTDATAGGAAGVGGIGGGGGTNMGWQKQWAIVKGAFPNASLNSSFRPGAITATGNVSYHSRGRAIDVSPSMAIFNWIRSHYGKSTKELIYSPAGNRQLHNGQNHYYTGVTRSMHFNHVHWAMAGGGVVGPHEKALNTRYAKARRKADDDYRIATRGRETAAQRRAAATRRDRAKASARAAYRRDLADARSQDRQEAAQKATEARQARAQRTAEVATARREAAASITRTAGGSFFEYDPSFRTQVGRAQTVADVRSAAAPLANTLLTARGAGVISPGGYTRTYARLRDETQRLSDLATRRARIVQQMDTLTGIRDERNQTAGTIRQGVNTYGGVFAGQGAGVTSTTVRGVLAARLDRIKRFANDIRTLHAQGWSTSVIRQVVDAGVEDGSAMAAALVAAPKADRDAINGTVARIDVAGAQLGTQAANYYAADQLRAAGFNAGGRTVDGLIAGLRSQDGALSKAMSGLADKMVTELRRALGIHSPSTVFAALGEAVPAGFAQGIQRGSSLPVDALARMYGTTTAVAAGGRSATVGGVRSGPLVHVEHQHLHDGVDVATMTQQLEFLSRAASI